MSTTQQDTTPDFKSTPEAQGESKDENSRSSLLRKAYGAATQTLRENHRDEFETEYEKEAKALGVDYKRKPTEYEKAEAAMRDLLAKHPGLREEMLGEKS